MLIRHKVLQEVAAARAVSVAYGKSAPTGPSFVHSMRDMFKNLSFHNSRGLRPLLSVLQLVGRDSTLELSAGELFSIELSHALGASSLLRMAPFSDYWKDFICMPLPIAATRYTRCWA
jgi:hypothetical protein